MFCNHCGKQAEEAQQYCMACGGYLKPKQTQVQVIETPFKFCRSCGAETKGRYCEVCGENTMQSAAKVKSGAVRIEQIKQTGNVVKEKVKQMKVKETLAKTTRIEELPKFKWDKEEALTWLKQGLVSSGIVMGISLILSIIISLMIRGAIFEDSYISYDGLGKLEKNMFNTLLNLRMLLFGGLFNGKVQWDLTVGNVLKGSASVAAPFVGLVFSTLIIGVSEKIRGAVYKTSRTLYSNAIMSVINGVVIALCGCLLTQSVKIGSEDIYSLFGGYSELSNFDLIKFSTHINVFSTFVMACLTTFFVLTFVMGNKDEAGSENTIISAIRKIAFTVLGFSFLIAVSMMIKMAMEGGDLLEDGGWIAVLLFTIYLTGFILSSLILGRFKLLEAVLNSESIMQLKMRLTKMDYNYYGIDDQADNFLKWWFIIAGIIVLIVILTAAYRFWKKSEMDLKSACLQAGGVSVGLGLVMSLLAKMSTLMLDVQIKASGSYFKEQLGLDRNKYTYQVKSGTTSLIGTWICVGIIIFILFMLMYWLISKQFTGFEKVMNAINPAGIWIAIGIFCVVLLVTFDVYNFNEGSMDIVNSAGEMVMDNMEDILESIFYY